jgi:hypothetical protein
LRDVRAIVGDVEFELLGNLAAVDQSGDGQADPGCAVQREETGQSGSAREFRVGWQHPPINLLQRVTT